MEAQKLLELYAKADFEMQKWMSYYEELAKYFLPFKDNVYGADISGEQKNNYLFDSSSLHANEQFAAMLHTLLSSPNQVFFDMATGIPAIDRNDKVRKYRQDVVTILTSILRGTNYHLQAHEAFLDCGAFGTLVMHMANDKEDVKRYDAQPIYNFAILENSKGIVDCIFRKIEYTVQQLVSEFDGDNIPEMVRAEMFKEPTKKYNVIHAIVPRRFYNPSKKNSRNMKFGSYYVIQELAHTMREGGFKRFPYLVTRFQKIAGETPGRGPAMKALPDARVLNSLQKTALKVAQKKADPAYLLADDGVIRPFKTAPGSLNYFRSGSQNPVQTLENNSDPAFIEAMSENIRERIRKAFYVDQLLLREGPQMTATEVMQRAEEQLRMLGPTQGRFENEFLRPLIEDLYETAFEQNLLPDVPEELDKVKMKFRFKSTMARSQNMLEVENFNRFLGSIVPLSQLFPEITQKIDADSAATYIAELYNIPEDLLHNEDETDMMRESIMEQSDQEEAMQAENARADILLKQARANREAMQGGLGNAAT